MDLRVKPEDDGFYTRCHSRESGNPKCWDAQDYKDFFPLDLRVKPEDDRGGVSVWVKPENDRGGSKCVGQARK